MNAKDDLEQDLIMVVMSRPTRKEAELIAKRVANGINNMITEHIECTTQVKKSGDQLDVMRG